MVRRADELRSRGNSPHGDAVARRRAAYGHGLRVFGGFLAASVGFFFFTFMWFRRLDGPMELPLPVWIMLLPTLVPLGAGVITGLIVVVVDIVRGRARHRG